ncbi:hypothetical protein [Shewanella sp. NIFS-20-20]|uniref:hypothetical protein n=1 Tax=Shewanella sp. NIFS-20-20 TaxID=2853806 RepID=UPI001C48FA35|nr:hypothetical protein [Shewanella sp. NIFS-20-20]MBV7315479.1 hypothetical protein [Shewanella sp. NIFS-20-20]
METVNKMDENVIVVVNGKPVEAKRFITNREGKTYQFDRVAMKVKGGFCLDQMREDEVIIAPGLIYREVTETRKAS